MIIMGFILNSLKLFLKPEFIFSFILFIIHRIKIIIIGIIISIDFMINLFILMIIFNDIINILIVIIIGQGELMILRFIEFIFI